MATSRTLPATLPSTYQPLPGQTVTSDVDTGGYDVMIGGYGFRLATDLNFAYLRNTEQVTAHRFDSSTEPGEQSLNPLPWIKSQSSFHAGAGQLNIEQGLSAFEYQQERVDQIRFDTSQGVDVWTPGVVRRLPTTRVVNLGSADVQDLACASSGGIDYAIIGGTHTLQQVEWASGADAAPTITNIDLTGAIFGGASNCTVTSLATDGHYYFALVQLAADGSITGVRTLIVRGVVTSTGAPTAIYMSASSSAQVQGVLGWAKSRLIAGLANSLYELENDPAGPPVDYTTLTAKFTHPSDNWTWTVFAESPTAILAAGQTGLKSSILSFTLDTSGGVPTLTGGASAGGMPAGEVVYDLRDAAGSFLIVGTSRGIRIATYDGVSGVMKLGPLSVTATNPMLAVHTRDRFAYGSFTNQQADGSTGLVRVDMSMIVDTAGRMAYAPDLQPPSTAATRLGSVTQIDILPFADRIVWVSTDGMHVEQSAPSAFDPGWLRTSRIRYDTTENKLFKFGRVTGTLDTSTITVDGTTRIYGTQRLGTFGFVDDSDPGEFVLPANLNEWLQLTLALDGAACELNTYGVKAYPSPASQDLIILTVNCFTNEVDRFGLEVTDPVSPRIRWQSVLDLKNAGTETRYIEFTNTGSTAEAVMIDQLEFRATSRPNTEDDFGGYITFKLRKTTN